MLRWRLLLGFVSLFGLLLGVGGYSIWLISKLETDINSILNDNYECIRNAHSVRVSILRLNVAYLRPGIAETIAQGTELLDNHHEPALENTVAALRLLARTPQDRANAQKLSEDIAGYLAIFRTILALPPTAQAEYDKLRARLIAQNLALTATTEDILKSNEQAMLASQRRAGTLAGDTFKFLAAALLVAAAVFIYTHHRVGRSLISPIEELTHSIEAMRAGRFQRDIPVQSDDELGRLSVAFNALARELRAYRHDTDEKIVRLNRSLRETIAAFPYPVMLLDADSSIWMANSSAHTFLTGIGHPDRLPEPIQKHLDAVLRSGRNYLPEEPRDAMLFRVSDLEVHYLPRILQIVSPEGEFSGAAVILIDVSRFRWLDDMKTNLISTISHEIRTPLTGIRMILHLLREKSGGDLAPVQTEMVQAACNDCERLLATLNGLLDLSRMEAGRTQLNLRPCEARTLIENLHAAFQSRADNLGIRLDIDVADNLPRVLVDTDRIGHALGNFVSNALKFAPSGSTIRFVADQPDNGYVRLSVIDSGPGVPEACHAHIFDKFFRAPGQLSDGVGLGLSIAREIIHAHDGRIGFQSQPHIATRFSCELPTA